MPSLSTNIPPEQTGFICNLCILLEAMPMLPLLNLSKFLAPLILLAKACMVTKEGILSFSLKKKKKNGKRDICGRCGACFRTFVTNT